MVSLLNPYLIKKPHKIPARNAVRQNMSQDTPTKGAATAQPKGKPANTKLAPPKGKPKAPKGRGTLVD